MLLFCKLHVNIEPLIIFLDKKNEPNIYLVWYYFHSFQLKFYVKTSNILAKIA